jgi:ABC-type nitrate/sulfonate/bicarbonate transport system permease component
MNRIITRLSIFFIGAVFGLCVGVAIGLWFTWSTIGRAVYDARCEQYQVDRETFYGDRILD